MMESSLSENVFQFTNSTGNLIEQLFIQVYYKVPGKIYPPISLSRKQSHSLLTYGRRLLAFLLSIQLKHLLSVITFQQTRTLHSVYRQESLAILSNSQDLHAAICKAQEYNIPLMQITILTPSGQSAVKQRMLVNFAISHFINQNFVLYGDWESRKEIFDCLPQDLPQNERFNSREGVYFRKGELIYAFIPLSKVATADQYVLQENLTKVRNMFYQLEYEIDAKHAEPQMDLSPQPSSELQPNLSQFGVMGAAINQPEQELIDNFNDSDNEMDVEA